MPGGTKRLFALLIAANLGAWAWAWSAFGDQPTLMGTALLAWAFGLRHAIDADHIAAIDNVVRKLMQEGRKPVAVGFHFSLGHSTVVILGSIAIAATAASLQGELQDARMVGGVISTSISSLFLLAIAGVNLVILRNVWRSFRAVRRGVVLHEEQLDLLLSGRGLMARLFRPLFRAVRRSWHMYPLGFLFGLGFDTATEIGLLGIAATEAARGMSPWHTLVFPALFTAGMALVDTADSAFMVGAYGWAFLHPVRKLWYNLTITATSVAVALLIGGIEGAGLIVNKLGLEGTIWSAVSALNDDMGNFGFAVIAIFALSWAVSAAIYRWKRYDELPAPTAGR
nr:HoxN/HupN/NixA family nickel/cobalt transporter [Limobrevibacterium gyesilva]